MGKDAAYWIEKLELERHPEGGFFRRTYEAVHVVATECLPQGFHAPRPLGTAIYYLLTSDQKSLLHRIKSDELWHFYTGSPLDLYVLEPDGRLAERRLGPDIAKGESFQVLVPAGCWFGARVPHPESYALVGCTVVPGFDFEDLELGERNPLIRQYPQHRGVIERLTT